MVYKWLSGQREKRTKETKAFFSLLFASTNLLFQRLKKTSDFSFWLSVSKATNKNKSTRFIVLTTGWSV